MLRRGRGQQRGARVLTWGKKREQDHQHLSLRSCRHLSCHLSVEDPREGGGGGCGGCGGGRVQEHLVGGELEGQVRRRRRRRAVVVAAIVLVLEVLLLRGRRHRSEEGVERGTRRSNTTRSSELRLSKVLFLSFLFFLFFLFSLSLFPFSLFFFLLWQPTTKGREEKRREGRRERRQLEPAGERRKGTKLR